MPETLTDQLMATLRARLDDADDLEIPPKVFVEMGGRFIDFQEGESLTVRFPVRERYQNPMGTMQGGMIVAAMDNAIGPLSFLVAPPSATTQLNTTYIRPVTPDDDYLDVEARVVERAGRQLLMTARATNPDGKIVAVSHATCTILARSKRKS